MQYNHIVIRFGELSLKGKNRRHFESQLRETVRRKLSVFPNAVVLKSYDRILVEINGEDHEKMIAKLQEVFGIHAISLAIRTESEIEAIKEAALAAFLENGAAPKTFKVSARRSDKHFPVGSMELNRQVGGYILTHTENVSVNVHHPDVEVKVEVKDNGTFISCKTYPGAGGLPIGVGGKAMLMLSGGIDSPVAGYLTMKRGVRIEAVHFHSPPFTSDRAKQKAEDLMQELTRFGGKMKLHVVHFTKIQQIIKDKIPASYSMTIMRRMMLRITERLAEERNAMAITNGENLGQVASQTMYSMHTINEVTNLPIIRPVVTMDKLEIIDISQKIGTYDISIRPYEDCCTIFVPAAPKTKPKREKANRFEQNIENMEELIEEALSTIETISFEEQKEAKEFEDLF
ncbi:tRNA 4-thiouridine(8) synthase ThiI [Fictibacillus sp. WQ 8-8]|uniref:tRNA uracil 4-sulfurtransferase ThiI n=1 Tax=unclassified Fictibacillus TaxID=2644029 RepID=UPI0008EE2A62|nr:MULTISPECIES: tRNA uracil 4-sulfurtransferase ThiI [unclassified Fictibacillus]MCQ6266586.1 tRNA 4-thiouridine(8) synthase ThiI [Fictibacillus sp. WQ 8-8]MED2971482.1 tRNA 4-thiouridine(8) synthase ThiI [Fictibacillus sp. B-59209]SFD58323.1 thiamine biosynthesis protein ThiI [Bacillus sp. OV194]